MIGKQGNRLEKKIIPFSPQRRLKTQSSDDKNLHENVPETSRTSDDQFAVEYLREVEWLPYLRFMLLLPSYKAVRFVSVILISCGIIWQTYLLLNNMKLSYFFQYSPFYFVEGFMTISTIIWMFSYKIYMPAMEKFKRDVLWSINMASDQMKRDILRECKYVQTVYAVELFLAFWLLSTNFYLWNCNPTKYFMISPMIAEKFPAYVSSVHLITIIIGSPTFVSMVSPIWYSLYASVYLKFQIFMLVDKIRTITQPSDRLSAVDDEVYQRNVTRCLEFYISRHQEIIRAHRILHEKGEHLNFLFALGTILVSLYTTFTLYSGLFNWSVSVLALVTFFFTLTATATQGQLHEDSCELLAVTLYNLPWNLWNRHNMKLFCIFHKYVVSRKVRLPFPHYFESNLTIIKSFAKVMYSVANILHSKDDRRN